MDIVSILRLFEVQTKAVDYETSVLVWQKVLVQIRT
jgi:hypothetical protein